MLEDSDSGQLEDIDVIPNEEMLLVHESTSFMNGISFLAYIFLEHHINVSFLIILRCLVKKVM